MFSFGGSEFLIIGLLALLLFGPEKIPQLARTIGRYTREFRKYKDIMESTLRTGMGDEIPQTQWQSDYEKQLAEERAKVADTTEGEAPEGETPEGETPEAPEGDASEPAGDNAGGAAVAIGVEVPLSEHGQSAESAKVEAPPLAPQDVAATSEDDEEDEA